MKILKKIIWALLILFVLIQFYPRPEKNIQTGPASNNIANRYAPRQDVQNILKVSCNDCHSNNTVYPWYSKLQPVAMFLGNHIQDGKKELNFDEFLGYAPSRQFHKFEEIKKIINEGEMPMQSYTLLHRDAKLTADEKSSIIQWVDASMDQMKAQYPPDSLVRKKKA
ncbi:MAG: heme-binding domain-containing protein [Sphingobacteriales bacterium]|nr:heme-binding domain-containing protein [Sphingobacteriales bacterium]